MDKHIYFIKKRAKNNQKMLDRILKLSDIENLNDNSAEDLTTSYSEMLRELRKNNPEQLNTFLKSFKEAFDQALDEEIEEPQDIALMSALEVIQSAR